MNCKNPIFIVGAPRSGTTLLRSVLDAHPNICCPPWETGVFDRLSQFVSGDFEKPRGPEANFCPLSREEILKWIHTATNDLIRLMVSQSGKPRWGEKTPSHVFHLDLIDEVFPEAQFIHIVRNGKDVVKSLQNVGWATGGIRWSVRRWVDSVNAGRASGEKLGKGRYVEVRYEELTSKPEMVLPKLCEFLGESFFPQMLEFNRPENNSWGLNAETIRTQPVNKRHYRELTLFERIILKAKAGSLLRELGY